MVKANRLIIIAALSIALLAMAGVASAAITVTVNTVQSNGYYLGYPTLISSESSIFGYNYTFIPDGTYTVWGTVANDGAAPVSVWVGAGTKANSETSGMYDVPASGSSSFSYTFRAASESDVTVGYQYGIYGVMFVPLDHADWVNAADAMTHTVDQGPMSNATAIFSNGHMTYDGAPIFMVS